MEVPLMSVLIEMGLKPTEVIILALLWQNIRNTRLLLDKLTEKVNNLESVIKTSASITK